MTHHDQSSNSNHLPSFRNAPRNFLSEALGGLVNYHPEAKWMDQGFLAQQSPIATETGDAAVALVSGGGSGHEPLHSGFLGPGMLSAVCPGLLFTSPNAIQITEATRWADRGRGVVHIVKNYTGDVMNFTVARQSLHNEVETGHVLVADDVATTTNDDEGPGRRGTAATIVVEKVCGAAAQRGDDLQKIVEIGQKTADNSSSMAIALASGHLPTTGQRTFELESNKMEVGVGIHGERGTDRIDQLNAKDAVNTLLTAIAADQGFPVEQDESPNSGREASDGNQVAVVVNGLGGTTELELNLIYGYALQWLSEHNIIPVRSMVGSFVTSVNMHAVSITLTRVDDEIVELLDAPTAAPAWPKKLGRGQHFSPASQNEDVTIPNSGPENPWLTSFLQRIQSRFDYLTELDRKAGDGDFGTNMEAAFGQLPTPIAGSDSEVCSVFSQQLLLKAGGTSGAVLGTLFRELSHAFNETEDSSETQPAENKGSNLAEDQRRIRALSAGLDNAVAAITELGGARVGDKTLIDALVPAKDCARKQLEFESDFATAVEAIHRSAYEGACSTQSLSASKGRASYLGDSTQGVMDPGALFVSWIFGDTMPE